MHSHSGLAVQVLPILPFPLVFAVSYLSVRFWGWVLEQGKHARSNPCREKKTRTTFRDGLAVRPEFQASFGCIFLHRQVAEFVFHGRAGL